MKQDKGIQMESNKFETLLPKWKTNKMKQYKTLLKGIFSILAVGLFAVQNVYGQCQVTFSGNLCVGSPITFTGATAGTTHDFDFAGVNSSTGQRVVNYAFTTAGNKKVTYITTLNGTKCTSTVDLVIKEKPTTRLNLLSIYEQCFEKNQFCFRDSTTNVNGAKITNMKIVWSDGQFFDYNDPKEPRTICFTMKDERGGKFGMYVEVTDENGCQDTISYPAVVKIREKIGARFVRTSAKNPDCDSVKVNITNISRIDKSLVKSIKWYWGDGTITTNWGPNITKTFYGQGTYDSKMVIETIDGCKDSFTLAATATVFRSKANILASKDSTCISDNTIDFRVDTVPSGATGFLWNFGDPPTGPQNVNNRTWAPSHAFSGLGPYQIKLTYTHPVCGNRVAYDTIMIIGPVSTIEIPFNRIAEFEVFQCPKDIMDSVHFKNFSKFYHNDPRMSNDDSTFYNYDGSLGHVFDNAQTSVKPAGFVDKFFRERVCAQRLWDFGDSYAPKCTTDVAENKNVNVNCQYSRDTLPVHYYKSWDLVLLSDFKNAPMEDAIFIDSNRLCKKLNVWPSDSFAILSDTLIAIPKNSADSALALAYPNIYQKAYMREKLVAGPGERFIEDFVDVELKAGDTLYIGPEKGPYVMTVGPKTVSLAPKMIVKVKSKSDTIRYLFTVHVRKDTLPLPLLKIRYAKGDSPAVVSYFKRVPAGKAGFDYIINYQRFRELYYAKIPNCQNVKLKHYDTCHPLKCEHEATKTLSMLHANAGGVGSGLLKESIECLGGKNPQYGITFLLSDLKPGCTFSDVQLNFDTFCNPNAWVSLSTGLTPGNRPPGLPYMGYQLQGNPPNRYSKQYGAAAVCGPDGCITVGVIVGNGVSKSGTKPLCADTQYYDRFACFPLIDPSFEVLTPTPNTVGNRKICKGDPIVVRPILNNKTNTRDLRSLRWELSTGNASPYYSRSWRRYIQEDYYSGQYLKDSGTKKIYNYFVQTRGGEDVYQVPCTEIWNDGKTFAGRPDTTVTAIISKWDTAADVSLVWDNIKSRVEAQGFDPFALDPGTIARMIWNNVGNIGNPASGARGCIDTTGFGKLIRFYLRPDPNFTKIIHPRDTNIVPTDSFLYKGKFAKSYTFRPQWSGYHLVSISMTSSNGKCDEFAAAPIIVGFAAFLEIPDSVVCQKEGTSLSAKTDFRMFHPDPINFGTWDPADYWRDPARQQRTVFGDTNSERFTRWDWSKKDDDANNPQTIFGGGLYGATGVGSISNPWKQLGGGGPGALYYKNDSGVYIMRVAAGDSTGCMDTITRRLFISRLDVNFGLDLTTPSCNSIIEFFDSSKLYDPCNWGIRNCQGSTPKECDFVKRWYIDWGDGKNNQFLRGSSNEQGLPNKLAHKYSRNGWFQITYVLETDQGCNDTLQRWVKIPGPRPKFEFANVAGNTITICMGDSLEFKNLTDTASPGADWTWFFGDGALINTQGDTNVWHKYLVPGTFHVFLQQYDTFTVPPNVKKFCPATYPDTPNQAAFIVKVLPRDTVRGTVSKSAICPGDTITFIDNSDTILKSYKWVFQNLSTGNKDSITVTNKSFTKSFSVPGNYLVTHFSDYDPQHPQPWCPTEPIPGKFLVDSISADFKIDSSNIPDFCFERQDTNGVSFRWGFGHSNDITVGPLFDFFESTKSSNKRVCTTYDSSGVYWVCFIARNGTGCEDTICKPVTVSLYLFLANVFTPGTADGKNDTYRVPIQGQDVFEIKIFNRWGERVFESDDPKRQWNGSVNNSGPDCPEGTYFYQLKFRFKGKEKVEVISGSINLIR